jgi:hypothetical protein
MLGVGSYTTFLKATGTFSAGNSRKVATKMMKAFFFAGFLIGAIYSVYKTRSFHHGYNYSSSYDSKYCKICLGMIPGKDHHCVWIDACISTGNMMYFLAFLAFTLLSLVDAGLIMLTSVCLPLSEVGPFILVPDKWCQRWNPHFEGNSNLTWTAGLHCFLLAIPILCLLLAKGSTFLLQLLKSNNNNDAIAKNRL